MGMLRLDHDNAHDFIGETENMLCKSPGGRKPAPLKSSWHLHDRFPPPQKKPEFWFAIDDLITTETLCLTKDLETAWMACEKVLHETGRRAVIRPFVIDEESLQQDTEFRKWKAQMGY